MNAASSGPSLLLKHCTTAVPSLAKLAPYWDTRMHALGKARAQCTEQPGPDGVSLELLELLLSQVQQHGNGVYSFPYLSEQFCEELLEAVESATFEPNEDEAPEAQIPEIVLEERCKPLFDCLSVLFEHVATPLAQLLFNLEVASITSIQFAQYKAGGVSGTSLHHDRDSDVTLVVHLGTEFTGGGTEFVGGVHGSITTVAPVPAGHAVLFLGRTTLHRGLPVEAGTRTLLVHWTSTE